jgi:predicted nucleic acid-binding protein
LDAPLLVDDREARSEAKRRGIEYFGSLRILARAKEIGLVSRVRPALDDLIAGGTYVGAELYWEFLRQVEENP